jgi:hypothetical protein
VFGAAFRQVAMQPQKSFLREILGQCFSGARGPQEAVERFVVLRKMSLQRFTGAHGRGGIGRQTENGDGPCGDFA